MPITLITGLPGHGKTLYSLARFKAESDKDHRPVFQCAGEADSSLRKEGVLKPITGLKLPWPTIDPMKWHECPAGSIVIIDEAQFVFPTRGRGEPPDWVARLATHRHLGIDIVLITQGPMLLDSFVRSLVDRHFDVVRKFGTHFATIHEYANGCRDIVRKSRGTDSIRHEWRYPKEAFGWYQSAEVHTVKRRIPMRVWLLAAVPVVFLAAAGFAYMRLNPTAAGERVAEHGGAPKPQPGSVAGSGLSAPGQSGPAGVARVAAVSPAVYVEQFAPRVEGLAYTAPAYDEVTRPVHAPYPAACVQSASRCQCYSQQGTRLDMPRSLCISISEGGFFIAWDRSSERTEGGDRDRAAEPPARPVLASAGNAAGDLGGVPYDAQRAPFDGRASPPAVGGVPGDQQSPARPRVR